MHGEITLENVVKEFSGGVRAVDDVTLTIADGEFLVLVGPSGCGKTTLLRLIAGLEEPTSGKISIGGREVTDLAPRHRDIAMVFQNYALYPHMSVAENLAYGLKVRRVPRKEVAERIKTVAAMLGLEDLLQRKPSALSGGQRQRVAMGRALAREPAAFLMDEPLSNLDAKLRVSMRAQLSRLHDRVGTTTVYVTHDQVEAMTLGQRVAVMRDGRIQQLDTPGALYAQPQNLFVAAFIGSPAMNLVRATPLGEDRLAFGQFAIPLNGSAPRSEEDLVLGIRPEAFEDADFADSRLPRIRAKVEVVEDLGAEAHVLFAVEAPRIDLGDVRAAAEDEATLLADEQQVLFTARVDARTAARPGGDLMLAVDPSRLHYFSGETGARLSSGPDARVPAAF